MSAKPSLVRRASGTGDAGSARKMNGSVATAVENFLADPPSPVPEALRTKLGFSDTDLLRLAHVNLRFLERLLCLRWPDGPPGPPTLQLYAFALAIRGWLRQVHIHCSYYKYIARMLQSSAATRRGAGTAPTETWQPRWWTSLPRSVTGALGG